jgi:acyl carrier protein
MNTLTISRRTNEAEKVSDRGNLQAEVVSLLENVLKLTGRTEEFTAETPLLGHLPEMDSLGAVGVIAGLEERFRIAIDDDEIDGSIFQTLGSLVKFVESKTK